MKTKTEPTITVATRSGDDPATNHQPEPTPETGKAQPQTEPLEDKDTDIGGGD
jgi:hypothetical protein